MIRTIQLQLRISQRTLVDHLDWQVQAGECWCIIGRNGAGKSTLLRSLAGLQQINGGLIEMRGRALQNWDLVSLARQRAFLPQSRTDAFGYRVIETVLASRHPYHAGQYWEGSDDHHAAYAALAQMDLTDFAERDVRTLSGGERQRAAIAALLAQDTPLLLLDEPANALDLAHQISVMRLLGYLCREKKKTVVMVGHDLNLAYHVASHALLLMKDGAWCAGTVAEMMQAPLLSECLGYPIEVLAHHNRRIFLPLQDAM
jgi:iron complex transport system ATP-binding protein